MLRYGGVGIGVVAIDYILYLAIVTAWPDAAVPANLIARLAAGTVGFVGHARFTFRTSDRLARSGLRYGMLMAANMAIASLLLMAMLPLLGVVFAKLASDVITITAGYLASRYCVFAPARLEATR